MSNQYLYSDVGLVTGNLGSGVNNQPLQRPDGSNLPPIGGTQYSALAIVITPKGTGTSISFTNLQSNTVLATYSMTSGNPIILPVNTYGWFLANKGESIGCTTVGIGAYVEIIYGIILYG